MIKNSVDFLLSWIKKQKKWIFLFFLIVLLLTLVRYRWYLFFTLENLQKIKILYGVYAPMIFIFVYAIMSCLFVPVTPFTITSGILFGSIFGMVYVLIGAFFGATLSFYVARFWGEEKMRAFLLKRNKRIFMFDEKIKTNGFWFALLLRILPIFPFSLLNYTLGLTEIKYKTYILTTMLGILPATFLYVTVGHSLFEFHKIGFVLAVFALIFFVVITKKLAKKQTN